MIMAKITALTPQKKLKNRFSIFVDGKFKTGIDGSLVLKYNLKVGDIYTSELEQDLANDDRVEMAYLGLINYISYRERCEHEIHEWLFKKGYIDLEDELVTRLKDRGFLSDARYARLFIRDRVKLKSWGPVRLRHELRKKRIDKQTIENEIDDIREEYDFNQLAINLLQSKIKYINRPTLKDKKRLWSFLQRRGYETSSIVAALEMIAFVKSDS